jgi:hypothetical protein
MAAGDLTYTNSSSTALDLNDGSTYDLLDIRGIYGAASDAVIEPVARRTPAGVYYASNPGVRKIELDIWVYGATASALTTNLRALWSHFYVDVRDESLGTLDFTALNSNRRCIKVIPDKNPDIGVDTWWIPKTTAKSNAVVTVLLSAPDPTFYAPSQKTATGSFSGTSNVNVSCANAGDVDAYPTIVWEAAATNPKVTDAHSKWFQYEETITAGQTVTSIFEPQSKSFSNDTEGDWANYIAAASAMVVVKHGTNNLVFLGDDAGDDGDITVTWYDRYSSHG